MRVGTRDCWGCESPGNYQVGVKYDAGLTDYLASRSLVKGTQSRCHLLM